MEKANLTTLRATRRDKREKLDLLGNVYLLKASPKGSLYNHQLEPEDRWCMLKSLLGVAWGTDWTDKSEKVGLERVVVVVVVVLQQTLSPGCKQASSFLKHGWPCCPQRIRKKQLSHYCHFPGKYWVLSCNLNNFGDKSRNIELAHLLGKTGVRTMPFPCCRDIARQARMRAALPTLPGSRPASNFVRTIEEGVATLICDNLHWNRNCRTFATHDVDWTMGNLTLVYTMWTDPFSRIGTHASVMGERIGR